MSLQEMAGQPCVVLIGQSNKIIVPHITHFGASEAAKSRFFC